MTCPCGGEREPTFHCLSLTLHCLSSTFHCLSLTLSLHFSGHSFLSAAFHRPSTAIKKSLPFPAFPAFLRLWVRFRCAKCVDYLQCSRRCVLPAGDGVVDCGRSALLLPVPGAHQPDQPVRPLQKRGSGKEGGRLRHVHEHRRPQRPPGWSLCLLYYGYYNILGLVLCLVVFALFRFDKGVLGLAALVLRASRLACSCSPPGAGGGRGRARGGRHGAETRPNGGSSRAKKKKTAGTRKS